MGIPLSSIGTKIGYKAVAVGSTAPKQGDTYPISGFTRLYDIKSTPDLNTTPNTADATTFDNQEFTTYVNLLKDLGGALEFTANLTDDFITTWQTLSNSATNQGAWFCIDIPGVTNSVVFYGKPTPLGMPALTANSLMEVTVSVVPILEPVWNAATVPESNTSL